MSLRLDSSSARRSRPRRGVVLIFVVAVLVLLAVIATTYLAMARVDRVAPQVAGGLVTSEQPLPMPFEELRLDVYNWKPTAGPDDVAINNEPAWRYRPSDGTLTSTYLNSDFLDEDGTKTTADQASNLYPVRQRFDPWLASREPADLGGGAYGWPKISRWLERWSEGRGWVFNDRLATPYQSAAANADHKGFFESPVGAGGTPTRWTSLTNAIPTYIRVDYPTVFVSPATYAGKAAVYPALTFTAGPDAGKVVLAGDADGDGVADSGLFPLDTWQVAVPGFKPDGEIVAGGYPGDTNNHYTRWYAAVRIVDNNAAINVNTAWRRNADLVVPIAGSEPTTEFLTTGALPNFGFFRSNIGLYELMPGLSNFQPQWTEFAKYRFGGLPRISEIVPGRTDYRFSSVAEALEMNLARRPLAPGPDPIGTGGGGVVPFRAFPAALSSNLAYLNGLINPRESRSDLESAFIFNLYEFVPNWGAADGATINGTTIAQGTDAEKESRSFTHFPAPANVSGITGTARPSFWWHALYDQSGTRDSNLKTAVTSQYGVAGTPYSGAVPPRTVRQLLTASNPMTTTARPAESDLAVPTPTWISYTTGGGYPYTPMVDFQQGTRAKVSVNTSTFGELWRNFFLTMKLPTSPPSAAPPVAAVPGDIDPNGRPGQPFKAAPGLDALYLRSAIAAVNTVDQRDGDDDITTYRIKLPTGGQEVMVAGAEQQLFITKAEFGTDSAGKKILSVSLTNPYGRDLDARGYKLGFMPTAGGSYIQTQPLGIASVAKGTTTPAPIVMVINDTAPNYTTTNTLVLLRTRHANGTPSVSADPKNPFNDSMAGNDDEMVCVDLVDIPGALKDAAGTYQRVVNNWTIASTGANFGDAITGARINPVALDNLPPGVLRADQATNNQFPLSGFPRDGDMMLIPYVGHYTFYQTGATLVQDTVPITTDVQVVPAATGTGQITGRFTPVLTPDPGGNPQQRRSFDWRARLFDNFTTLANPMSDATPNIAEGSWLTNVAGHQKPTVVTNAYGGIVDEKAPVEGFVNLNTASAEVLSMVPFVTNATTGRMDSTTDTDLNRTVAEKIVNYRKKYGPFRSVLDVLDVFPDTTVLPNLAGYPTTWTALQGNFYASTSTLPGILPMPVDYANQYGGFIRVSNLLTTRSDSFTIYVLIQQWQDFGQPVGGDGSGRFPLLVPGSEKRFAVIVDRSQLHDGDSNEETMRKQSVSSD